jgi:nucleotide-binding universal stress UspA family protein
MTNPWRILVAVDESTPSRRAVEFLRRFNLGRDTEILVLAVVEPLPRTRAAYDPFTGPHVRQLIREYLADQERRARRLVDAVAAELPAAGPPPETLVRVGEIGTEIIRACEERGVDLVVLGSRGRGGFAGLLLGSVSQQVSDLAPCSVLVVRPPEPSPGDVVRHPLQVVVAVDGLPASVAALDAVARLPWPEAVQLRVLSVADVADDLPEGVIDLARESAVRVADQAATRLQPRFANVETEVTMGPPARGIIDLARAWSADLVVVGTRDRPGLVLLTLGSVSRQVLLHAPCAVLIARGPARASSPEPNVSVSGSSRSA